MHLGEEVSMGRASDGLSTMNEVTRKPRLAGQMTRYFQFPLWVLIAAITIGGLCLGWYFRSVERQRSAVKWITDHGGYVRYGHELDVSAGTHYGGSPRMKDVSTPPGPAWLRSLFGIDGVSRVSVVSVDWSKHLDFHDKADELARALHELRDVEYIAIRDVGIRDLYFLENHKRLRWLDIRKNPITDLNPLGEKPALSTLIIESTGISDLSPLGKMDQLAHIWFRSTDVSDITPLYRLEKLKCVRHADSLITDEEVASLAKVLPRCTFWDLPMRKRPRF